MGVPWDPQSPPWESPWESPWELPWWRLGSHGTPMYSHSGSHGGSHSDSHGGDWGSHGTLKVLSRYSYGAPVYSHGAPTVTPMVTPMVRGSHGDSHGTWLPWWLPWWRLGVPGTLKVLPRYSYGTPMSLWKAIPVPCAGYWFASAGTWYSPSASASNPLQTYLMKRGL